MIKRDIGPDFGLCPLFLERMERITRRVRLALTLYTPFAGCCGCPERWPPPQLLAFCFSAARNSLAHLPDDQGPRRRKTKSNKQREVAGTINRQPLRGLDPRPSLASAWPRHTLNNTHTRYQSSP